MKRSLLVFLILCFALPVGAQHQTGVRRQQGLPRPPTTQTGTPVPSAPGKGTQQPSPEDMKWNEPGTVIEDDFQSDLFAAPALKFTTLNDSFGFLAGLRAGWIINRHYVIGLGGYKLVNDVPGPTIEEGIQPDLSIQYGGVELEYIIEPENKVHFSLSALIGIGNVQYDFTDTTKNDDDTFWVIEPAATVYVNLTEYLQTGFSLSYRLTPTDVNLDKLEESDLTGLTATLSFCFGTYE